MFKSLKTKAANLLVNAVASPVVTGAKDAAVDIVNICAKNEDDIRCANRSGWYYFWGLVGTSGLVYFLNYLIGLVVTAAYLFFGVLFSPFVGIVVAACVFIAIVVGMVRCPEYISLYAFGILCVINVITSILEGGSKAAQRS